MTREQLDALKVDLSDYANWAPTTRILVLQMFEEDAAQRALIEQQAKEIERLREALRELHAVVKGECASLLNEDSGGDAELAIEIEALLKEERP